jgi:hypothetical protein
MGFPVQMRQFYTIYLVTDYRCITYAVPEHRCDIMVASRSVVVDEFVDSWCMLPLLMINKTHKIQTHGYKKETRPQFSSWRLGG